MSNRVLLGKFPDGDNSPNGYGLRISKPGYEVTVANPDNEKLIFNSDWIGILPLYSSGLRKIFRQNAQPTGSDYKVDDVWIDTNDNNKKYKWSGSAWVAGTLDYISVAHDLSYIPFVSAMVNVGSRGWEHYAGLNLTQRCIQLKTRDYYARQSNDPAAIGYNRFDKKTITDYLSDNPQRIYSYNDTSGKADTVRIRAFSDRIELYSDTSVQFYYMIYRQKAF